MGEFDIKVLCDYPSSEGLRKISVETCGLVCSSQIWWAVKNFPDTLTYAEGRIFLMI